MFIYGLLTGLIIGVVLSVALLFIFAATRIASRQEEKEKTMQEKESIFKEADENE